jgi:hypothetical protein
VSTPVKRLFAELLILLEQTSMHLRGTAEMPVVKALIGPREARPSLDVLHKVNEMA